MFHLILALSILTTPAFAKSNLIIGTDDIEKLRELDPNSDIYIHSAPTGRMQLPGTLGIKDYCTVSLINENQIITATHCLVKNRIDKLVAFFEYYDSDSKKLNPYKVTKLIKADPVSDVTILELEGTPGKVYGFYPIAQATPEAGVDLIIYEHPGLQEKSVSRKECMLRFVENDRILHECDTQNYSSGSPILNTNFELIGIHQGGITTMNEMYNYGQVVRP